MPQRISHNSSISATFLAIRLEFAPLHPGGVQIVAGRFVINLEAYHQPAIHMFRVLQTKAMAWEVIMGNRRVAVVTAGGSGMGAGAAKKLAAEGYRVGILSSSGKGEALAEELGGIGVTGSNESNDDLAKLVDKVVSEWGRIDVLVNSAGHGPRAPVIELSDEDWHRGMEVYFLCAVRPTRLVTPIMLKQKSGVIINISTFAAFEPDPVFPTSGVFRAGLAAYAKLYADQYAANNIRMNNVLPGFIDSLPEKQEFKDRIPMQRYGKTEEVAGVIAFLASDEAGYITGQNIRVDGGITRSV
jgi:NAD(P)-dependent dehydrogenase (short-subunit alcohol dehydrogenase family)